MTFFSCIKDPELFILHITVASETLESVFLLNNSMNIHHRTLEPLAMCFYWPVWHFNFFTFLTFWAPGPTFIDMRVEEWFSLTSIHIFQKKKLSYFGSPYPKLNMVLYKKPPLKISFLLSIWVLTEVKMKYLLEKVTQVILHFGTDHGLSMSHIYWIF